MLRIGLVELAPLTTGGASTYALAIRQALETIGSEVQVELVTFANHATSELLRSADSQTVLYRKHASQGLTPAGVIKKVFGFREDLAPPTLPEALKKEEIDLAWFLAPNRVISAVKDTPFVMTVWDLGHRDVQGFAEFSSERRWEQREAGFAPNLGRAFHVMTDSKRTGESLERIYGVYRHNWTSVGLPLPAPSKPDNTLALAMEAPYFYYPASYWPHKNHRVLIDALTILTGVPSQLVFSGHDEGHREALEKYVADRGLADRVSFHGRISDEEVLGLIDGSIAVVMPSLLGPTNYPPLEALRRGKPALVSHVHEFDEIPNTGLIIVDGVSPPIWAEKMAHALAGKIEGNLGGFETESSNGAIREVLEKFMAVQRARLLL